MILDDIVNNKRQELAKEPALRFRSILLGSKLGLVCELKIKSPTHPEPFTKDPLSVIADYRKAQVDAISVVTDSKYFGGSMDLVRLAKETGLPVIRKDFIIEERQIVEVQADALLLIARILSPLKLKRMVGLCLSLGIEPVVEINNQSELAPTLDSGAHVIAVNSRNLQTQTIDLAAGLDLMHKIPADKLKMFFSGITTKSNLLMAKQNGANGVLVGTSILESNDRVKKIKQLKEVL